MSEPTRNEHDAAERAAGEAVLAWLDERAEHLDAVTLAKLGRARRAALAQPRGPRLAWTWAAGAAAACVLALALWPRAAMEPVPPAPVSMETFSLLASPADAELLESLDYYLWLEAQAEAEPDHAG